MLDKLTYIKHHLGIMVGFCSDAILWTMWDFEFVNRYIHTKHGDYYNMDNHYLVNVH